MLGVSQQVCVLISQWPGVLQPMFHTTHKRPLSSAGSHSPTSQVWVCARSTQGGHGHAYPTTTTAKDNLKPTTDTKLFSRLQKLEAMDATTFTERLF